MNNMIERNWSAHLQSRFSSCFWEKRSDFGLTSFCVTSFSLVILLIVALSFAPHVKGHEGMDPTIRKLTEQLEKEPNRIDLWITRGQVYRSYGKFEESLQDLEKAWILDQGNKKVDLERSLTLSAMRRDLEAEAVLNHLLQQELGGLNVIALAERGVIRERTGRPELAIEDYTALLGLQPVGELYLRRSKLLESLGRYEEAASGYEEGLNRLGESILLKKGLLELWVAQGKFNEALELIDDQILRSSVKTQWYLERARVLDQMGQSGDARKTYEQALSEANQALQKRHTSIHLIARAKVLFAMGNRKEAMADLNEALEQTPKYGEAQRLIRQWGGQ